MNELTSDEIPEKFAEWLLSMGCLQEIVPPVEKVAEKCRGRYYMVWRSLMGKVEHKDIIRNKRLQVFCDDVRRCQKKNVLNGRDIDTVVPEELLLWHKENQLKQKVEDAEARISKEKDENLHRLADKANSKCYQFSKLPLVCQRYLLRKRLQDGQRQALLLQRLADTLREKKSVMLETSTIVQSLCGVREDADVESTLDKCITSMTRQGGNGNKTGASLASAANPAVSSTIASTTCDSYDEEAMSSLARCHGDVLFKQLYEKRAGLCSAIPASQPDSTANIRRVRSSVCHTASLQCGLALEAMKNRILFNNTGEMLARNFIELNSYQSSEACELAITRCQAACSEARIASFKNSIEDIANQRGIFAIERPRDNAINCTSIHAVDRAIESKKEELKRLIVSATAVERKTQIVRERLLSRFNSFHDDGANRNRFGGSNSLLLESISALRQFYEEKRDRRKSSHNLSMDLDISDSCSFNNLRENGSPTFVDELKLYLKKFSLEQNRKLVLESGDKIWIFECINSFLHEILTKWRNDDTTTTLLCPAVTLKQNLRRLAETTGRKEELEALLRSLECDKRNNEIDTSPSIEEEQKILDTIKKRLNDNILSLQKTKKTIDDGVDNLQIWSDNDLRQYISDRRKIDGKTYMQYEKIFLDC